MGGEAKGKLFELSIVKQVRANYALIPIVFVGAFGMCLSIFQMGRTLLKSPDVSINRRGNPHPYDNLVTPDGKAVQYKYFAPTIDYSKLKLDRPKIE